MSYIFSNFFERAELFVILVNALEKGPTYDRDMDCCWYYFYIQSGIQIYTKKNKFYFLNSETNKDLLTFTKHVLLHANDKFAFREIKAYDYKVKKVIVY